NRCVPRVLGFCVDHRRNLCHHRRPSLIDAPLFRSVGLSYAFLAWPSTLSEHHEQNGSSQTRQIRGCSSLMVAIWFSIPEFLTQKSLAFCRCPRRSTNGDGQAHRFKTPRNSST